MREKTLSTWLLLSVLTFVGFGAVAKEAAPVFDDPAFEHRFKGLAAELRCVKCQNQSLADSPAGIAGDLRREVKEKMQEGLSDDEIVDYLVARYGDFIRYRPAFKPSTYLLWIGPFLLFIVGLSALYFNLAKRRRHVDESTPLSDQEKEKIESLLKSQKEGGSSKS